MRYAKSEINPVLSIRMNKPVNQHYVDRVIDLSASEDLAAAEDIYAENGMKLVAKGVKLSAGMRDHLIVHKLKKPLETSLTIASIMDARQLTKMAEEACSGLVDRLPFMPAFHGPNSVSTVLHAIDWTAPLHVVVGLMHNDSGLALQRALQTLVLTIGLDQQKVLTPQPAVLLAMAGLFHDVGELYLDPLSIGSQKKFDPPGWRAYASHPIVGRTVLEQMLGASTLVGRAVLEHHEHPDGCGFPLSLAANRIGSAGMLLSLSSMLLDYLAEYDDGALRCAVSMLLMPGQETTPAVRRLLDALRAMEKEGVPEVNEERMVALLRRIGLITQQLHFLEPHLDNFSRNGEALYGLLASRFMLLQRAFSSTGMDVMARSMGWFDDLDRNTRFEVRMVLDEIENRLQRLAFDIGMRLPGLAPAESGYFEPLMALLYGLDVELPE